MAFIKNKLCLTNVILFAGLLMGGVVAQSAGADTAQSILTTKVFPGIGSSEPVTVVLTVKPATAAISCETGPLNPGMGFIGHQCYATDQPGGLPNTPTSLVGVKNSPGTLLVSTTVYTTFISSYIITTTTAAPYTVTRTISQIIPSMTVTAMCNWADENIITPCTTVVLATAGIAPIVTIIKSAAIPSANNPFKPVTVFVKRIAGITVTFVKGLDGFVFDGFHGTLDSIDKMKASIQRRDVSNCDLPPLYTPMIMTVFSILNAIGLFYSFDVRQPRKAGYYTAIYVVVFILTYIICIYIEYYSLSIAPAWKYCLQRTEVHNMAATGATLASDCTSDLL